MPRDLTIDVLASYTVDLLEHTRKQHQKITEARARLTGYSEATTVATGTAVNRRRCLDSVDRGLDEVLAVLRREARLVMTMRQALSLARDDERRPQGATARRREPADPAVRSR